MTTFVSLFETILTADKTASREAARKVRKFVYSSRNGTDDYNDLKNIINSAPNKYLEIFEDWRQENFVMAISVMYFLHDKESQPDFLFSWLFHLLRHKNGYIRHAAVRMIENELGPLTVHLRFPGEESTFRDISPQQADDIILKLFTGLHILLNDYWKPMYKKYKYVGSLPSGTYKSVQMILNALEEDCGDECMRHLEESLHQTYC
jgi:hypothetical protein